MVLDSIIPLVLFNINSTYLHMIIIKPNYIYLKPDSVVLIISIHLEIVKKYAK